GLERLYTPAHPSQPFPSGEDISLLPVYASLSTGQEAQSTQPVAPTSDRPLSEETKLQLIRFISGEFAKALKPMPGGKEGFLLYVGKPVNEEQLNRAVATHGAAVNTGDAVQITKLDFRGHTIQVDVNGGGKPKRNWRDHIQVGMGVPIATQTSTTQE